MTAACSTASFGSYVRARRGAICRTTLARTPPATIALLAGAAGLLRNGPAADQPVAVIGLGDLEMGRLIVPSLSTVRVHGDAIGRTAAKLTRDRSGPRLVDLGFELVLRDSG
jgi:DNA-binding LacI/PurR family transcriptional regulator